MKKNQTFHKKKIFVIFICCTMVLTGLIGRLVWLMGFRSDYYYEKAEDLHERERDIKAARGEIIDAAGNVHHISHSQSDSGFPEGDLRVGGGIGYGGG